MFAKIVFRQSTPKMSNDVSLSRSTFSNFIVFILSFVRGYVLTLNRCIVLALFSHSTLVLFTHVTLILSTQCNPASCLTSLLCFHHMFLGQSSLFFFALSTFAFFSNPSFVLTFHVTLSCSRTSLARQDACELPSTALCRVAGDGGFRQ